MTHIGGAMAGMSPVTVLVFGARQPEVTRTTDALAGRKPQYFEPCQRLERFDGRAGRVGAAGGAVIQRTGAVILQLIETLFADPLNEGIGVVAGLAGQRQNFAIGGIDGHNRAMKLSERIHGHFLQADIQGQVQIRTPYRFRAAQPPHHAPLDVGFVFLVPGQAMQKGFITFLQTVLALKEGAPILNRIKRRQFFIVDVGDIADHMRRQFAVGVVAQHACANLGAGQPGHLDRDPSHFLLAQAKPQRHALETLALRLQRPKLRQFRITQIQDVGQLSQQAVEILHQFWDHFQAVGDDVIRERLTITVVNHAANRRNRRNLDLILARQAGILLMAGDLQIHQPNNQRGHAH